MAPKRNLIATARGEIGVRGHRVRNAAKAQVRRQEILTGAARAFAHGGYDGTNMEQIAGECGLAKGHIYHYFRSKEEIFTEIRVDAMSRIIGRLDAIAHAGGDDPELMLRKSISCMITRFSNRDERYEPMMGNPVSLSPASLKRVRTLFRRIEQIFIGILRRGMETGVFARGDPKLMTFVILRAANTVTNWYREGGKWKLDWIADEVTQQLIRSVHQPATPH
ncbi:MAG: TetR/AcrR family transcriptional regulator [Candidatus Binataceae bacterium]